MICWFKWKTLTDGSLRLNPLNPSKRTTLHKRHTVTLSRRYTKTVLRRESKLSYLRITAATPLLCWVIAFKRLKNDDRPHKASHEIVLVLEMQFKEPVCHVWFITADYNRQVLRCNTPTECTKGCQIMRVVWIKVVVVGAKMDASLTTQSREDDI